MGRHQALTMHSRNVFHRLVRSIGNQCGKILPRPGLHDSEGYWWDSLASGLYRVTGGIYKQAVKKMSVQGVNRLHVESLKQTRWHGGSIKNLLQSPEAVTEMEAAEWCEIAKENGTREKLHAALEPAQKENLERLEESNAFRKKLKNHLADLMKAYYGKSFNPNNYTYLTNKTEEFRGQSLLALAVMYLKDPVYVDALLMCGFSSDDILSAEYLAVWQGNYLIASKLRLCRQHLMNGKEVGQGFYYHFESSPGFSLNDAEFDFYQQLKTDPDNYTCTHGMIVEKKPPQGFIPALLVGEDIHFRYVFAPVSVPSTTPFKLVLKEGFEYNGEYRAQNQVLNDAYAGNRQEEHKSSPIPAKLESCIPYLPDIANGAIGAGVQGGLSFGVNMLAGATRESVTGGGMIGAASGAWNGFHSASNSTRTARTLCTVGGCMLGTFFGAPVLGMIGGEASGWVFNNAINPGLIATIQGKEGTVLALTALESLSASAPVAGVIAVPVFATLAVGKGVYRGIQQGRFKEIIFTTLSCGTIVFGLYGTSNISAVMTETAFWNLSRLVTLLGLSNMSTGPVYRRVAGAIYKCTPGFITNRIYGRSSLNDQPSIIQVPVISPEMLRDIPLVEDDVASESKELPPSPQKEKTEPKNLENQEHDSPETAVHAADDVNGLTLENDGIRIRAATKRVKRKKKTKKTI